MVNVRKADGSTQPYDREKVLRTCYKLRLSKSEAEEVADEVEQKLFEGITTKRILDIIFEHAQRHKAHVAHMIDLREAISLMRPKPDFEKFVAILLEHAGYKTVTNEILQGKCIDHEIDVIASKDSELMYVEVKHHVQFHTFTGLDTVLVVNSAFQDLLEGYLHHTQRYNFTKPMLVLNTKVSEHARKYAACRGIGVIGWKIPERAGIEHYIDQKLLYPITILKNLDAELLNRLGDYGIYTLKQLVEADRENLVRETGTNARTLRDLIDQARQILGS